MALKIIVSYDDTDYDKDALALGRLLALGGAELSLAYVAPLLRRRPGGEGGRGDAGPRRQLRSAPPTCPATSSSTPATSVGLTELAERQRRRRDRLRLRVPDRAGHRQAGHLGPQTAARRPGRDRRRPGRPARRRRRCRSTRSASSTRATRAARETATSLASALGAGVAEHGSGPVDLLVVGSRPEAPAGKVVLSATSDYAVEAATYPVLVLPRGTSLAFSGASAAPAV